MESSSKAEDDCSSSQRLSRRSVDVGGAFSSRRLAVRLRRVLKEAAWVIILLAGTVNRDLNSDLAALDLFTVHLRACLLLHLFTRESDEAETTALTWLVAGLELADHELRDRAEGDFGGGWRVVGEDLEELMWMLVKVF